MWNKFILWLKNLFPFTRELVNYAEKTIIDNGGDILAEIAWKAVKGVESTTLKGRDKFDAAVEFALKELAKKAIKSSVNAINIAIESAVAKLNA